MGGRKGTGKFLYKGFVMFCFFIIISDMLKIVEASNGRYSVWTVKEKKLRIN